MAMRNRSANDVRAFIMAFLQALVVCQPTSPPRGYTFVSLHPCRVNPTTDLDMRYTCFNVFHMTIMIQIRNVPDALHRRLKSRAALAGMSLSDYLLGEIRQVAERPTLDELRARLESHPEMTPSMTPAQAVRAERDRR
jgi:plasmid stability protein